MLYLTDKMSDTQNKSITPPAGPAKAGTANETTDSNGRSSRNENRRSGPLRWLAQRFRGKTASEFRDDLAGALADGDGNEAGFSAGEREMLNNILGFREVRIEDVMIPRADVIGVDLETTLAELLELFETSGHSRMPVYSGDLDDPKGMVHIRDVLGYITRTARTRKPSRSKAPRKDGEAIPLDLTKVDLGKSIGELRMLREVLFVPHAMLAADLLQQMRSTRTQMALVIDEYGGTDGLVSMEDIVEMLVGDIEDEHDDEELAVREEKPGVYMVLGGADLEEVADSIGEDFVVGEAGESVDTIAGLVISVLGHHPAKGETCVAVPGFEFKVVEAGNRRIRKVRISRI